MQAARLLTGVLLSLFWGLFMGLESENPDSDSKDNFYGIIAIFTVIALPVLIFVAVYALDYARRETIKIEILNYYCFIERQTGKSRIETRTEYLSCSDLRQKLGLDSPGQLGEERIRYVDAGQAALVRADIVFLDGSANKEFYIKGKTLEKAKKQGVIDIKRPFSKHYEIETIDDWTYIFAPIVWLFLAAGPQLLGILVLLIFSAVGRALWALFKKKFPEVTK